MAAAPWFPCLQTGFTWSLPLALRLLHGLCWPVLTPPVCPCPPSCRLPGLQTPQLTGEAADEYPKLVEADEPPTKVYGDAGCLTVQLPRPYKFDNNLASVAQRARRKAVKAAEYVLRANGTVPDCINLDTPRIFYRVPVSRWAAAAPGRPRQPLQARVRGMPGSLHAGLQHK